MKDSTVLRLTANGLKVLKTMKTMEAWKNNYRIKETTTESGETVYWIEDLKGLVFDSRKEAEEFCLVSFCNNFNLDMFS